MKAADVMASSVIGVKPDNSVQEVADILLRHRISGVPVIGTGGELLGIVSEGDLMRRAEAGTERHRSWWLELLAERDVLATEFVKANARKAADVMTRRVVTADPDTPLAEIATLLEANRIKRVPIVKDGRVVGIVSRANLLQAIANLHKEAETAVPADDSKLRETIVTRLNAQPWRPWLLTVTVHNGTVDLWGVVDSQALKDAARVAVEVTPGVRAVNDNLVVRTGTRDV